MRKATKADMNIVVDIITTTFAKNPGVNWMFKKKSDSAKQIKRLAQYAFIKSYLRDGVYISSNEKGVALCYKFNRKRFSLIELWYQIKFSFTSINFFKLPKVLKRESYRKKFDQILANTYTFGF